MAVKVLELHHHGIRIGPGEADLKKALHFYRDVLGLQVDEGRPEIRGVPGYWVYVGDTAQIHLMGAAGLSPAAKGQGMDPTITHVALAVPDVQEAKKELDRLGAVVLGVSRDGPASHQRFAGKYRLTFPLLSDPDAAVAKAYGVYKQKSLYGRTYWGIERTTFLIDEQGRIAAVFPKVRVDGHTEAVLEALRQPAAASR